MMAVVLRTYPGTTSPFTLDPQGNKITLALEAGTIQIHRTSTGGSS